MTLTQGLFDKVKVIGKKRAKCVSGPYLSSGESLIALTSHKDRLRPEGVA